MVPISCSSAERTLRILDFVSNAREPLSVTDISEQLTIQRTAVYRSLVTLQQNGFVTNTEGKKKYVPGHKLVILGQRFTYLSERMRCIKDEARSISDKLEKSCISSIREGKHMVVISNERYGNGIDTDYEPGQLAPVTPTAAGRAVLCHEDKGEIARLIEGGLIKETEKTIINPFEYLKMLEQTKAQGYACEIGEYFDHLACISVPLVERNGSAYVSLTVVDNADAVNESSIREVAKIMMQGVSKLTERIHALALQY